ncbi:MAG: hypothetical protein WCW02_03490 [Candidatus Buchananbacteria bacterium]
MDGTSEKPNLEELKLQTKNGQPEQWTKEHPETIIPPENLRECGPEIAELELALLEFESTHPLTELLSITELTSKEAPNNLIRESAKQALIPLVVKLTELKQKTNITSDKYRELKIKYLKLSRAVGIINNNQVHHNR